MDTTKFNDTFLCKIKVGTSHYYDKFCHCKFKPKVIIDKKQKKFDDKENKNEPILYIVLNKTCVKTNGEKLAAISHLTSKMLYSYYNGDIDKVNPQDMNMADWLSSFNGYGNTVILAASEKEIYQNCLSSYDNIMFTSLVEDSTKVAHHNWLLDKPCHVGVAFFGIKNEMPKWLRKLPLFKM